MGGSLRIAASVLAALLLLSGGTAPGLAQRPLTLSVEEAPEGWHPVVRMHGVVEDAALREALASGLPLRFRFRLELWEKALLDRLAGMERVSLAVVQDPLDGYFTVEDGRRRSRYRTLGEVEEALERALVSELRPTGNGRYYYLAVLDIETLSLSDLEELQRWLRGEAQPAVEGRGSVARAVESGLRRAFVRMIRLPTRKYEARSRTFTLR